MQLLRMAFARVGRWMRNGVWPGLSLCSIALGCELLGLSSARALETSDYAVRASAQVQTAPPQITLVWPPDSSSNAANYIVSRKMREAASWQLLATLSGAATNYTDTEVSVGAAYEYQVQRTASGYSGYGYVSAGIQVPAIESRGKVLLIVDHTHRSALTTELNRLAQDLVGDGWTVLRRDVGRDDSVASVKAIITAAYNADLANVKCVFLFGRVPVPYSGNIAPDGHIPDHQGAWPADVFYADMNGTWTDATVNTTKASQSRHHNLPGDGKFDQSLLPSPLELQIGRVDLSDLPAFAISETELLRRYLNKDHNFRQARLAAERRGLIADNFGTFNGEAFAASGWRNFSALFGADKIATAGSGQFISALATENYLWAYGCGGGSFTSASGIGSTSDFAASDLRAVFTMLFGSYFGDWDSSDNIMRAVLAQPNYGLTCSWAGRPHWFYHHMALGETIGVSALATQNNSNLYKQANYGSRFVHLALMGDPTLRLHPVAPPVALAAQASSASVTLRWTASDEPVLGYNIYRAANASGPFTRLNSVPMEATDFTDSTVGETQSYTYQVRAAKLEAGGGGTYFNLSQAVFTSVTVPEEVISGPLPTLSISAGNPTTAEADAPPASFIITPTGLKRNLTIHLQFKGTATMGEDFEPLPTTVVIPPKAVSIEIEIVPVRDAAIESVETVVLALVPDSAYNIAADAGSATVSIVDSPHFGRVKVRRQ